MISGLNQEIEILGKLFHVQTELFGTAEPCIRTEVFLGGKLVATRELPLGPGASDGSQEQLRALMKEQHQKILAGVVERARRYRERQQAGEPEAPAKPFATAASVEETGSVPGRSGSVDIALRVRRTFEQFRLRVKKLAELDLGTRLEKAAEAFAWILHVPAFGEIRIDEQLRFNLLKDQLDEWLLGRRERHTGERLWSETMTFNRYLAEVNNRSELAAFDRDLLSWALRKLEDAEMNERMLDHLGMLAGRDAELDLLLERPAGVSREVWRDHLRRVLADIQ